MPLPNPATLIGTAKNWQALTLMLSIKYKKKDNYTRISYRKYIDSKFQEIVQ